MVATGTLKLGGQEMVALFLARGLPSHGLDTVVAHTPWGPSDEETADSLGRNGVPVVKLVQHNVEQWLEIHRPDVISIHGAPDWLVAAAAAARIPIIETLHGVSSYIFDRSTWRRERLRSRHITAFVAVSDLVRQQYLRSNPGYPPDRIIIIPNGVDTRHIVHRDRAQARAWLGLRHEFLFVSLARYCMQKNTFGLVAAFTDVIGAYPETRLLCAGDVVDPSYFEQVRHLRDGLSCAGQIQLCGPCPDVSAVLAAADAFVLDSFFEGWSMASMEAIFTGLPAILSEVGGAREQVGENGRRGLIVENPLGDPEATDWRSIRRARFRSQVNRTALVEAMCTVIAERDHWRNARDELKAEAIARFSVDLCVQRHSEVLKLAAARMIRVM
jgi:glycosyltransferase involved in cell wall biosynthesis